MTSVDTLSARPPAAAAGSVPRLGVVPAIDLESTDDLLRVIEKTCEVPGVTEYKLGGGPMRLALDETMKAIRAITDLPIHYDHQKAGLDVPANAGPYVKRCKEAGVDGLLLFPVAGPEAVRQFVGETLKAGLIAIPGGDILLPDYSVSDGGFVIDDAWERIVAISAEVGCQRFVVPAKLDTLERRARWVADNVTDPVLYIVGFGPMGGDLKESFAATEACPSRRVIVGRSIHQQPDPGAAARRFVDEIMALA